MIWLVRKGDRIHFPNDIHYYDVVKIFTPLPIVFEGDFNTWVKLEDCLGEGFREVRLSTIKEEAKLIRRTD